MPPRAKGIAAKPMNKDDVSLAAVVAGAADAMQLTQ